MRKILLVCLCLLLVGCQDNEPFDIDKINLKYKEMEDKLVEYGKLVFENDQWLNENSQVLNTFMNLRDLFEENGYDISMFINPETNEQCDLDASMIEFIISDVSNVNDIKYEFNPVLVCSSDVEQDDTINKLYNEYYDKLANYMESVYSQDVIGNLEVGIYVSTLNDFRNMGYDISMFVNLDNGDLCDLERTYAVLEVKDSDIKDRYEFSYYLSCEGVKYE